ncbi:hypothetical protein ACFQXA_25265 [Nocardiopsis composta]
MDGWKGAGRAGATWRARAVDGALWAACTGVLAAELSGLRADPRLETAAAAALLAAAFAVRRAHPFAALWAVAAAAVAASIANVLGVTASFPITYALPCVLLAFDAGRRSSAPRRSSRSPPGRRWSCWRSTARCGCATATCGRR